MRFVSRLLLTAVPACGQTVLGPVVSFSAQDEPVDGLGDSLRAFTGLIRTQSTRADRACQDFDVSALTDSHLAHLFSALRETGAWDDTIVIVTAVQTWRAEQDDKARSGAAVELDAAQRQRIENLGYGGR